MSEWKEVRLKNISNRITSGGTPSTKKSEYYGGVIPWLNTKEVNFNRIKATEKYITDLGLQNSSAKLIDRNSVVVAMYGATAGKVAINNIPLSTNQACCNLTIDENKADYRFIFYSLWSAYDRLENLAVGAAQQNLNVGVISDFSISLPPLPEQRAIADVLSSLDDKIDLLHRQNQTLESLAQTLFRQWFIEEADEDWEEGVLGDVIEIFDSKRIPLSKKEREQRKEGILYPYYGAAQIMDYINDYIFDGEYILLGEDGTVSTDEGYPVLQYATGKFWVNNHAHVIKAKCPYTNFFIWNYLLKKNISEIITGAVQPKINQKNLKSLDFPMYPEDLVTRYNRITLPISEVIQHNQTQIRTLENLRDTLLPKLMSGEVKVVL